MKIKATFKVNDKRLKDTEDPAVRQEVTALLETLNASGLEAVEWHAEDAKPAPVPLPE